MTDESSQTPAEPEQDSRSHRHPTRAAVVYMLAYLAVAVVGGLLVSALHGPVALTIVVTLVATAALALSLLLVLSIIRLRVGVGGEVAIVLLLLALFALIRPSILGFVGRLVGNPDLGQHLATVLPSVPGQLLLGNVVLIVWAAFLGRLVSRMIREGKLLLPVAVVASLADIFTVFWGVVAEVSEKAPEVVETFSAAAPVEAPEGVFAPILTFVGIGDFLFLALFLAVAMRYSMAPVKTLWATFVLMLIAPLAFIVFPNAPGMPGLPFLSLAVLWANWQYLEFTREEKRALGFAAALVVTVAAGVWIAFHR
ncbi:MAG: hypothetical protein JXA57_09255 [Armatimonadetes bacterium]|nr:hypothetical protein [Armatimonadota bacterium]